MKPPLMPLPYSLPRVLRAAAVGVPLGAMLLATTLRADDEDRPRHKEGFFSRLFAPHPHPKARRALPAEETIEVTPTPNTVVQPPPPGMGVTAGPAVREEVVQEPGLRIPPGAVMPPPAARTPRRISEHTTTTTTRTPVSNDEVADGTMVRVQTNESPPAPKKQIARSSKSKVVEETAPDVPPTPRPTKAVTVEHDSVEAEPPPAVITSSREAIPKRENQRLSPAPSPNAERQSDVAIVGPDGRASRSALGQRPTRKPDAEVSNANPPEERATIPAPQNDLTAAAPERAKNGSAKDNNATATESQRLPSINENGSAQSPANMDMARSNKEAVQAQRTNAKALETGSSAPGVVNAKPKTPTPAPKEPAASASTTPPSGAPKTMDLPNAKKDKGGNGNGNSVAEANNPPGKDQEKPNEPATTENNPYPVGTRTAKAGFVHSPYPPYQELDATGLASGSKARDPITGKIFRVP